MSRWGLAARRKHNIALARWHWQEILTAAWDQTYRFVTTHVEPDDLAVQQM
jgi:hypothetical protein